MISSLFSTIKSAQKPITTTPTISQAVISSLKNSQNGNSRLICTPNYNSNPTRRQQIPLLPSKIPTPLNWFRSGNLKNSLLLCRHSQRRDSIPKRPKPRPHSSNANLLFPKIPNHSRSMGTLELTLKRSWFLIPASPWTQWPHSNLQSLN